MNLAWLQSVSREAAMDQAILRLLIREKLATGGLHPGPPGSGAVQAPWRPATAAGIVTGAQILMVGTLNALGCGVRFYPACFALLDAKRQVPRPEPIGPA